MNHKLKISYWLFSCMVSSNNVGYCKGSRILCLLLNIYYLSECSSKPIIVCAVLFNVCLCFIHPHGLQGLKAYLFYQQCSKYVLFHTPYKGIMFITTLLVPCLFWTCSVSFTLVCWHSSHSNLLGPPLP